MKCLFLRRSEPAWLQFNFVSGFQGYISNLYIKKNILFYNCFSSSGKDFNTNPEVWHSGSRSWYKMLHMMGGKKLPAVLCVDPTGLCCCGFSVLLHNVEFCLCCPFLCLCNIHRLLN